MADNGKNYWRSLDQLSQTDEFKDFLHREFPKGTADWAENNGWTRRSFLTTMGASLALAGLTGCRRPVEKIVPYVTRPENRQPGTPVSYATTMPLGQSSYGLLVTSYDGRPTKVEGNSLHPSSNGASSVLMQASILDLYDPDRSQNILQDGKKSDYESFVAFWNEHKVTLSENKGAKFAILSESFSSPTMERIAKKIKNLYPSANFVTFDPLSDENVYNGLKKITNKNIKPVYKFENAKVIASFDSDILRFESESLNAQSGFGKGRRVESQADEMNRLYVAEANYSMTGAIADHRLRVKSSQIGKLLLGLVAELKAQGLNLDINGTAVTDQNQKKYLSVLASDLLKNKEASLLLAGARQAEDVHAIICAINYALGNNGNTVEYHELDSNNSYRSDKKAFTKLIDDMKAGKYETLLILGGNPVYSSSGGQSFASALNKVATTIHLSSHIDETSAQTTWHIPKAHFMETWSDARAFNSALSVVQPMIQPLYGAINQIDLMTLIADDIGKTAYEHVRDTWKSILSRTNFENEWKRVLHDGIYEKNSSKTVSISIGRSELNDSEQIINSSKLSGTEIGFYQAQVYDGRFANNGWLQELPDSITKLTWDNAALLSPATAEKFNVSCHNSDGDVIEITVNGKKVELPIWIVPGHADDAISVAVGYGRTRGGRVANKVGQNVFELMDENYSAYNGSVSVASTGRTHQLANTQDHGVMKGESEDSDRPIVRENTLANYKNKAEFFPPGTKHPELIALWDEHSFEEGYQWGMTIDLNSCIGCNSCTIACQSENNIPVVGKEQTRNGREMHWLRVDRYYSGMTDDPDVVVQPVACHHCENAPCEQVCPVAATVHDEEGLNTMVYNRCIGTRYCSNNCPYKVRRFNFFNYTKDLPEIVKMAQNPDVTVRFRGVMEKCTYCVQRISKTKISKKVNGEKLQDGDIQTACQQACPTGAIVFGDINDKNSKVAKLKKNDRNYNLLQELNIKPRTSYLAKLRNPNPELEKKA